MNQELMHEEGILIRNKFVINPDCKPFVYLIDQVMKGFAPIILICGKQRIGKSCFGLSLSDILYWIFYKKPFPVTEYVFFNARRFLEKGIVIRKKIIIIDEASKDLSKSEWYSLLNQVLSKIIETQGDLNNIYIIIIPHASRLAPMHKIYVDMKIVMKYRGVAKVFFMEKDHGELSGDIKRIVKQRWWGIWRLPKPDPELWKAYEKLAEQRKREIALEEMGRISDKERDWICPVCNQLNAKTNNFCVGCGIRK